MQTYLRRFYFDSEKLRERTLIEFAHALHTGRMVAVTGSGVTKPAGYKSWADFINAYLENASNLLSVNSGQSTTARTAIDIMIASPPGTGIEDRVRASVAREALRGVDRTLPANKSGKAALEQQLLDQSADLFAERDGGPVHTVKALLESLDIRRFATLNYDLELELALMAPLEVRKKADTPSRKKFDLRKQIEILIGIDEIVKSTDIRGNWWSKKSSGRRVESDIQQRERPDRMLEFAIGSLRIDRHIMHLHGRVDDPASMVVGLRDYDRMYRRTDLTTLPFEACQQLLFSANPVLFVGIGMSEDDVNRQLQELVSKSPYRHVTPTFLIWNSAGALVEPQKRDDWKQAKRLDWLHRLGVMVIYEDELLENIDCDAFRDKFQSVVAAASSLFERKVNNTPLPGENFKTSEEKLRSDNLDLLPGTLDCLGEEAVRITRRSHDEVSDWRSMKTRLVTETGKNPQKLIRAKLWSRDKLPKGAASNHQKAEIILSQARPVALPKGPRPIDPMGECMVVLTGPRGVGKGCIARALYEMNFAHVGNAYVRRKFKQVEHRLLINAGFSFDTDSMLDALVRFLRQFRDPATQFELPASSRQAYLSDRRKEGKPGEQSMPALIIINGMERFFDREGKPLSVELDLICRSLASSRLNFAKLQCVFLGTDRIKRYFEIIAPHARFGSIRSEPPPSGKSRKVEDQPLESAYLEQVRNAFDKRLTRHRPHAYPTVTRATIPPMPAGDPSSLAKSFFKYYLDSSVLKQAGVRQPGLCFDLLRALAFIGSPTEPVVLRHAPVVRSRLDPLLKGRRKERVLITQAMSDLVDLSLVVPVQEFEDYQSLKGDPMWCRYGLHKALLDELRGRSGISLNPSKRYTAFNLSLYAAQPIEGDKPNATVHDELGMLVDRLIGSYKDKELDAVTVPTSDHELAQATRRAQRRLPPGALRWKTDEPKDATFLEHRNRTKRLLSAETSASLRAALAVIRGYFSTSALLAVDPLQRRNAEERDGALLEHAERLDRLLRVWRKVSILRQEVREKLTPGALLPAPPFYGDELVWLQNEIGVVHLTMGSLYKAQIAFDAAEQVNSAQVEHGDRSHNWRRITLNRITLDIERGRLTQAEGKIASILESVNNRQRFVPPAEPTVPRAQRIIDEFGKAMEPTRGCFDQEVMHDEILAVGLALGHRAMCANLRGRYEEARQHYEVAANLLRRIGQPRAYAMFLRHATSLVRAMKEVQLHDRLLADTLAVSQSGGQTDIAFQARLISAWALFRASRDERQQVAAVKEMEEAKDYSIRTDIYRLRVDAGTRLARVKLATGDAETALGHANDALIYATAHGMTLRKIVLRMQIGEIYFARGDEAAGQAAIMAAIEEASRIGFQPSTSISRLRPLLPGTP